MDKCLSGPSFFPIVEANLGLFMVNRFNVRVYGLWVHPEEGLLVTDEIRGGREMTKFPGGGLDFGEGLEDALKREFREEMGAEIEVGKLFYINEFLQLSAFNPRDQVLSVYYYIKPVSDLDIPIGKHAFDFPVHAENAQIFRYVKLSALDPAEFTFPIDRRVAEMLKQS
jgi:8-oxo-dGTP diphosphatase